MEISINRPDTKYQLGFSVQNGMVCFEKSIVSDLTRGFDSRYGPMCKESVNAVPKVVGLLRFPPTGKVDRVG